LPLNRPGWRTSFRHLLLISLNNSQFLHSYPHFNPTLLTSQPPMSGSWAASIRLQSARDRRSITARSLDQLDQRSIRGGGIIRPAWRIRRRGGGRGSADGRVIAIFLPAAGSRVGRRRRRVAGGGVRWARNPGGGLSWFLRTDGGSADFLLLGVGGISHEFVRNGWLGGCAGAAGAVVSGPSYVRWPDVDGCAEAGAQMRVIRRAGERSVTRWRVAIPSSLSAR